MSTPASDLDAAWLLHQRPYRETSALAWFLTLDHGRVDLVVRGVRSRQSRYRALLQPFTPLHLSWRGRGQLTNLHLLEASGSPLWFHGEPLVCALYANELLSRLLPADLPCPAIFREYSLLLHLLTETEQREPALRRLELALLAFLDQDLPQTDRDGQPLRPEIFYSWVHEQGWQPVHQEASASTPLVLDGASLLAILKDDWRAPATRLAAKKWTRWRLQPLLGSRPLQSRALFYQLASSAGRATHQTEQTQARQTPAEHKPWPAAALGSSQ
ncbi:DNA repair protein RecO [Marinospirillum sp. MEB164]|uniref:DNA repair protein RecO n=1 Tax=Marinospirillum alkalitolerans TaxID=3123374 RepID=A0ABW8PXT6_9GAMM